MSERPIKVLLADILDATDAIIEFVEDITFEEFLNDRMRRDAVARNIAVIGEAINKLPISFIDNHFEVEWHKAKGMRNSLIHEYFGVDFRIIWNTVKEIIPPFRQQVQQLLVE